MARHPRNCVPRQGVTVNRRRIPRSQQRRSTAFLRRPAARTSVRRKATRLGKRSAQDGLGVGPKPFAEMDFSNDLPTESGIELRGAFDGGLEQRLARRQGAGPVRPSLVIEPTHALVAQLDRASDFESEGREFESLRARHFGIRYWRRMPPFSRQKASGCIAGADELANFMAPTAPESQRSEGKRMRRARGRSDANDPDRKNAFASRISGRCWTWDSSPLIRRNILSLPSSPNSGTAERPLTRRLGAMPNSERPSAERDL